MTLAIRAYEPADWEALCRIHDAARVGELKGSVGLDAFLSLEDTYEEEELFDNPVYVAVNDGAVVGFIAASSHEITWLYVDPALQRSGIGSALVAHVLALGGDRIELEVLDGNVARDFYERMGFVHAGTTTGKLAGNANFTATGHTLVWHRPATVAQ
ncbi:GNAT family N-acetyltransferase [Demequina aestuarii]|uniref:GNAT family N-acetyltransferase n=1 Tax=Demequina aestuarii TaxID=327095 RepID=UPI000785AC93|nr:GNAT family N-acetyltransferase [Demequina aestuarii]